MSYRLMLAVVLFVSCLNSSHGVLANSSEKNTLSHVQSQPAAEAINVAGSWVGTLSQPGTTFDFSLSLSQDGNTINGTSSITRTSGVFQTAIMSLTGSVSGNNVNLQETKIISSTGTPLGSGSYWCIKTLTLSYGEGGDLGGPWKQPGCNSGTVSLHQISRGWTIMVYIDGDNDLEATYKQMYQALDSLKVNEGITVVALWDGTAANDTEYKVITSAGPRHVSAGREYNMGDPQSLENFINYARQNFPAVHYALALRDHGSGVSGAMYDMSSKNDNLTVHELGVALNIATLNGSKPIDVLFMDACLMGMIEDAYELRNTISYYVASESIGFGYVDLYNFLLSVNDTTSPKQLAELIADEYYLEALKYAAYNGSHPSTISVANMEKLVPLFTAVHTMAKLLSSRTEDITKALRQVQRFDSNNDNIINLSDDYIDIFDFARLINEQTANEELRKQTEAVMQAVTDYVVLNLHTSGTATNKDNTKRVYDLNHSYGVSIFFPSKRAIHYSSKNINFATGADWNQPSQIQTNDPATWGGMLVSYIRTTNPNAEIDESPPDLVGLVDIPTIYTLYLPSIMR